MDDVYGRIEESRRRVFLGRLAEATGGDPGREVAGGRLGEELGLPYEYALGILSELEARGWLRASESLQPPAGPMVRVTRRGLAEAGPRAA